VEKTRLVDRMNCLGELRECVDELRMPSLVVLLPSYSRVAAIPGRRFGRRLNRAEAMQELYAFNELHRQKPAVVSMLQLVQLD
jgi:hypothetical protein